MRVRVLCQVTYMCMTYSIHLNVLLCMTDNHEHAISFNGNWKCIKLYCHYKFENSENIFVKVHVNVNTINSILCPIYFSVSLYNYNYIEVTIQTLFIGH